jgi:hypothetical protein
MKLASSSWRRPWPTRTRKWFKRVRTGEVTLVEAERRSVECTHAEVGAYLVGIWGLPPSIVETAAWHHLPSTGGARTFAPLTAVHGSNVLIGTGDFSHLGDQQDLDEKHLEMDGVQFLSRVKQMSPDRVRIVLTGQADMQAAMNAVNEGNILRFLTKPCDKITLSKAVTTGLVQYRLVVAEKGLLEHP